MSRKLGNWINEFQLYMGGRGSPVPFTQWAGIFAVAAVMERKCFMKSRRGTLYPNLYCMMVGPPGVGKTQASDEVRRMIESNEQLHVAPSSVTKASLIDSLNSARRDIIIPLKGNLSYNALTVVSNELGTFLPSYESDFMSVLTDIYDNKTYSETRRTNKLSIKIDDPMLNLLAPTTPSYLNNLLPEGAWDQGFLSRVLLVYSGSAEHTELFGEVDYDEAKEKALKHDLAHIARLQGQFRFEEDVVVALEAWHKAGGPPIPTHPKLAHYNTRRTAHLLKLCMIASAADNDGLVITLDHYVEAQDWLIRAEATIPDIFKAMKNGGDARVIEEAWHFLYELYLKKKEPIAENRLFHFLQERTPAHNVVRIADVMEKAGLIDKQYVGASMGYVPRAKRAA